jgi:L-aspartate oxidase
MAAEIGQANLDGVSSARSASGFGVAGVEGSDEKLLAEAQQLMESNVGIVRDGRGLTAAIKRLLEIKAALPAATTRHRAESRNIVESGLAIARAALARTESRGGHYRSDYPVKDDVNFRKHSVMQCGAVRFE